MVEAPKMHFQAPGRFHIGNPQHHAAVFCYMVFEGRQQPNQNIQLQMFGHIQNDNAVEAAPGQRIDQNFRDIAKVNFSVFQIGEGFQELAVPIDTDDFPVSLGLKIAEKQAGAAPVRRVNS